MPPGRVADTPDSAEQAARELDGKTVVKAQVLVGGRGKAGGVALAETPAKAREAAERILGMDIKGERVQRVLVAKAVEIDAEYYVGLTLDRARKCIRCILSASGGMDIEEVAANDPEKIRSVDIDPRKGARDTDFAEILSELFLNWQVASGAMSIIEALTRLYLENDCTLVEINPLALTGESLSAIDAKIVFDDNGLFRHPDIEELRNPEESSPDELEAREAGLSFVSLEGNIGCMVNGAGLAMATMDMIKLFGQEPANFLDVGGSSNPEKVLKAMEILLRNPSSRVILVNIFGGITRCDDIARGILMARERLDLRVPLVVRLIGTNEEEGRKMLEEAGVHASGNMMDAVGRAVQCVGEEGGAA